MTAKKIATRRRDEREPAARREPPQIGARQQQQRKKHRRRADHERIAANRIETPSVHLAPTTLGIGGADGDEPPVDAAACDPASDEGAAASGGGATCRGRPSGSGARR